MCASSNHLGSPSCRSEIWALPPESSALRFTRLSLLQVSLAGRGGKNTQAESVRGNQVQVSTSSVSLSASCTVKKCLLLLSGRSVVTEATLQEEAS